MPFIPEDTEHHCTLQKVGKPEAGADAHHTAGKKNPEKPGGAHPLLKQEQHQDKKENRPVVVSEQIEKFIHKDTADGKKNGKGHRQKGADHAVNHQPLQRKKDPGQQRKEQQLMAGNKRME